MSKNQNNFFCFLLFYFLLFFPAHIQAKDNQKVSKLSLADSLFQQKKYTESFEIYEEILTHKNLATPQMLMKMAYIKEGLGDYSNALYFLDLYYQKTSDKRARNKMHSIAEDQNLSGFKSNDSDFFMGLFYQYYIEFNFLIIALALFFGGVGVYRKLESKPNATGFSITSVVVFIVFVYLTNFTTNSNEGIIVENHAYLMTGPSAGADLVEIVQKGHKIVILDETGPWLKVYWNEQIVFIRASKVRKIS